jgi:hypothetical protein
MPIARTITFSQQLDAVCQRMGYTDSSTLEAARLPKYVAAITTAYRTCLEGFPWMEALVPATLAPTAGRITWSQINGAEHYDLWTADPATDTAAQRVRVLRSDSLGLLVDPSITSVFALYTPRAPQFDSRLLVLATTYAVEDVRYYNGIMYRCLVSGLGSTYTDPTKWAPLPLLWLLSDAVTLLAVADLLGNQEHERAQSADLRRQADDKLTMLSQRQG